MADASWSTLIKAIAKATPLLASVIPLPGASIISQVIASVFGGDADKPDELASLIEKDPNAAVKLAEIQSNMKIQLEQIAATNLLNQQIADKVRLDTEMAKIESDRLDRASAREQSKYSRMPAIISFVVMVGFFILIFVLFLVPIKENSNTINILFMLFGTAASAFNSVIGFWIGSSVGANDVQLLYEKHLKTGK